MSTPLQHLNKDAKEKKRRDSGASDDGYQGDGEIHSGQSSMQASPTQSPHQSNSSLPSSSLSIPSMHLSHLQPVSNVSDAEKLAFLHGLNQLLSIPGVGMSPYQVPISEQFHGAHVHDTASSGSDTEPEVEDPLMSLKEILLAVDTKAEKHSDAPVMPTGPENIGAGGFMASLDSKNTQFILPKQSRTTVDSSMYNVSATPSALPSKTPEEFPDWNKLAVNPTELKNRMEKVEIQFEKTSLTHLDPSSVPLPPSPKGKDSHLDIPLPDSEEDTDIENKNKKKTNFPK